MRACLSDVAFRAIFHMAALCVFSMWVRICVWTLVALAACVQLMSAQQLISFDGQSAAFDELLPAALGRQCSNVLIMHHKRLPELEVTLRLLASLPGASQLAVTVAQSLRPSEASAANASAKLLQSLTPALGGMRVRHRPTTVPEHEVDGTYSVDAQRYGTKRNSFRNLLMGLHAIFDDTPSDHDDAAHGPAYAIVMEDDVELAEDTLDFLEMGASLLESTRALLPPEAIKLVTTFCIPRKGRADYGFKGWLPGDWISLRADRYRRWRLQRVTFKTFAWIASREVYEAMVADIQDSMLQMHADAGTLHASLRGCPYCDNFCYDHYLEWRWRNGSIVCPEVPRARQLVLGQGGGMTERPGDVSTYHGLERSGTLLNTQFVPSRRYANGEKVQRGRRVLNSAALWLGPALAVLVAWEVALCRALCRRGALWVTNGGRSAFLTRLGAWGEIEISERACLPIKVA